MFGSRYLTAENATYQATSRRMKFTSKYITHSLDPPKWPNALGSMDEDWFFENYVDEAAADEYEYDTSQHEAKRSDSFLHQSSPVAHASDFVSESEGASAKQRAVGTDVQQKGLTTVLENDSDDKSSESKKKGNITTSSPTQKDGGDQAVRPKEEQIKERKRAMVTPPPRVSDSKLQSNWWGVS